MKNSRIKLSLDELQVESFVTSINAELSGRIAGGLGEASHPTHTDFTDPDHPDECTCPGLLQESSF